MQKLNLIGLGLSFIAFFFSIEKTCKIEMRKKPDLDENSNVIKKNDNNGGLIEFLKNMTPLGLGVSASCVIDFMYSVSAGAFGSKYDPTADVVVNMIIFTILEIISFIILFYLVYGILSIFKSHGGNEKARRNVAGWTTVIVSFILIFFASQIGIYDVKPPISQEVQQNQTEEYSSSENISVDESFEGSREDIEKFGRLVLCGYWQGTNGTDLNISTDRIVEVNSKTYQENESYSYSIHSMDKNSNGTITVKAEFIQGGTSFYADFIFKDLDNVSLKNYATNETSIYQARTKPYPQHLDNNLQFIFLYGRMGNGFYMDLESLQVLEDKTGWSVNVISANMDKGGQCGDIIPMKFSISIYDGKPFFVDKNQEIPLDINDTTSSNMLRRNAFLTSYYYAFGRNYGSRF